MDILQIMGTLTDFHLDVRAAATSNIARYQVTRTEQNNGFFNGGNSSVHFDKNTEKT